MRESAVRRSAILSSNRIWRLSTLLGLSLLVVSVGTLVPAPVIGWLRTQVPLFAVLWDWLDATMPGWNPLHIIFFAWIAFLWRLLAPAWRWWRIPLVLGAFGALTESLQVFAPGRTPRGSDVLNDLLGIGLGLAVTALLPRVGRYSRGGSANSPARSE